MLSIEVNCKGRAAFHHQTTPYRCNSNTTLFLQLRSRSDMHKYLAGIYNPISVLLYIQCIPNLHPNA
jgi:hypothetical protein